MAISHKAVVLLTLFFLSFHGYHTRANMEKCDISDPEACSDEQFSICASTRNGTFMCQCGPNARRGEDGLCLAFCPEYEPIEQSYTTYYVTHMKIAHGQVVPDLNTTDLCIGSCVNSTHCLTAAFDPGTKKCVQSTKDTFVGHCNDYESTRIDCTFDIPCPGLDKQCKCPNGLRLPEKYITFASLCEGTDACDLKAALKSV